MNRSIMLAPVKTGKGFTIYFNVVTQTYCVAKDGFGVIVKNKSRYRDVSTYCE